MTGKYNPEMISIILVEPQIPENIGAVARAMSNMGLNRLVLVSPRNADPSRIARTATGESLRVVREMETFTNLDEALGPYQYLAGATARTRSQEPAVRLPRQLAAELIPLTRQNRVGILFGPEDRGLSNEQLRSCHCLLRIPTAQFSSLNLAHAVMIVCYEIFTASHEPLLRQEPRLANTFELEGMYGHLKAVCTKIGFIDPQNPEHWMLNIRRFLYRRRISAREARLVRGLCRQLDWYTGEHKRGETPSKASR